MLAQRPARILIELLHLGRHGFARDDTEAFDQPEGKATGQTAQRLVPRQREKRLEQRGDLAVDEMLKAAMHLGHDIRAGLLVDEGLDHRAHRFGALHELADRVVAPHETTLLGKVDLGVGGVVEAVCAQVVFWSQRRKRG